ncbi:MAG: NAD(P)/FAD-dependent oxidoreductase [Methanoregulaceae archaeon]|nr:NAD(P)/FAD-dependent oxidoreductase [Methanoregulaceae archaeon]
MVYDVVVVGAGPAGTACARFCAESGLSVLCIEEHATIGHPVQCAGLLSRAAFEECRVSTRPVMNRVSGARVLSGMGSELLFDAGGTKAYVVDRGALDREMAAAAAAAGAEFRVKTAFLRRGSGTIITRGVNGHEEVPYRMLIAADGPRGCVARAVHMERPPFYLAGIQAEIPHRMDTRFVELHPAASPDFFGWVIPAGSGRARVGLCGFTDARERFASFFAPFGTDCIHLVTGTIPIGTMPRTYGHRTLFIGDAAGFAKPTSGGGVYTGVRSARHAAATAFRACEAGDFSDNALARYEQRWKDDFGRELALGLRFLKIRQQMSPEDVDRIIRTLDDPDIIAQIIASGDMDRPSRLLRALMKNPKFCLLAGILFRSGVRALIK